VHEGWAVMRFTPLSMIHDKIGNNDFENEIKILDLDFVKNYKGMEENEKKMAKADEEKTKEIEAAFQKNFAEFSMVSGEKTSI
jgi:hypothetical protein